MVRGKAETFDGNGFANAFGINAGVVEHDAAAERVAHETNGKIVDDVEQSGKIEDMFGDVIHGAGGPSAIAVSAEVKGVDVIVLAEAAGDPVPIAGVIERAVNENQRRLGILAVIPELKLEAVRIKEMGDGFQA
jgi:hypothetical protein